LKSGCQTTIFCSSNCPYIFQRSSRGAFGSVLECRLDIRLNEDRRSIRNPTASIPITTLCTLYLVATPIGHLSDMTHRAIQTLASVDRIGCEDTRVSSRLLSHYGISTPLFPFHQHNEHHKVAWIMERLAAGESIALITDAGTPGISDPGYLPVREAVRHGYQVRVIPGADACTTALTVSGLPADRYVFEGFLPQKKGRRTRLGEISERSMTTVLYESPNRLLKLLGELEETIGPDRLICVCRELTKLHEEHIRGTVEEVKAEIGGRVSVKGEIVVVISPASFRAGQTDSDDEDA
jgi:16S rRNA (cytidine1402-2'-O)-methyltransferase